MGDQTGDGRKAIRRRWLAAALAPLALGAAAFAAPVIDDPNAKLSPDVAAQTVGALVVRPAGPVWWTVSNGKRNAYILGVLASVPYEQAWNKASLTRRLEESEAVVLAPTLSSPPSLQAADKPPAPLPPAVEARLAAIATAVGMSPARYLGHPALEAGALLLSDFRASRGDGSGVVSNTVAHLAQEKGRPVSYAAVIPAGSFSANLGAVSDEAGLACLNEALDEVQAGPKPFQDAVKGWAEGDVRRALAEPRGIKLCNLAIPHQAELQRRATQEQVTAIARSLAKAAGPGKPNGEVFVVNLRSLLADGGILDQLRASKFTIEAPQPQ